jgi:superfamily II DNA helicase RecQ
MVYSCGLLIHYLWAAVQDYKQLGMLRKQFPRVPVLALTATATDKVQYTDGMESLERKSS